jgi:UDP-N-acetylmuramate dehydrogenase
MGKVAPETLAVALERLCPGGVRQDEPLAKHVTFRIGGPADILVQPRTLQNLIEVVTWLYQHGESFIILGRGSNVLVADRGVRGIVIKIGRGQERVRYSGTRVIAESGVSLPHLSRKASERGLAGIEFAAGIPGSVGGAVVMNAGAHGHAIAEVVEAVRVLTPVGEQVWGRADCRFRYRHSRFQEEPGVALEIEMALTAADAAQTVARLEEWLKTRAETQPLGPPSSGCVFRNPEGDHAGRLIDIAGAKGARVGGVVVSALHANYMLNAGDATAADVLSLIEVVRARVREQCGVTLETEIKQIGDFETA